MIFFLVSLRFEMLMMIMSASTTTGKKNAAHVSRTDIFFLPLSSGNERTSTGLPPLELPLVDGSVSIHHFPAACRNIAFERRLGHPLASLRPERDHSVQLAFRPVPLHFVSIGKGHRARTLREALDEVPGVHSTVMVRKRPVTMWHSINERTAVDTPFRDVAFPVSIPDMLCLRLQPLGHLHSGFIGRGVG